MAIIKCKMCGGDIELTADKTFGTCDFCGSIMTFPKVDDEQRAAAFNRGNHFRRIGEFDKALAVYERIVREDDTDAEAHWCSALCRFGIEYVEDPVTYEYLPTCHRASFDSFLEDVDYLAAVEHSEGITKRQYQKDGAKIAEVQRGILATSQNTEPYDVFICYKESDENGDRTKDSMMAQDIYYQLIEQGHKVFFARITLEDVAGAQYEPYIFAALNSAKVMIVVGTKPEYLNAVWVKNEWSRFLAMMRKDRHKLLLPCYRDMDPYDMPEALSVLQSYDMSKIGFMQDLIRGIKKIIQVDKPVAEVKITTAQSNIDTLVKRAAIFLEDGDVKSANDYCEKALDIDPECADAYVVKLLIDLGIRSRDELSICANPFDDNANYRKAVRFGDDTLRSELNTCLESIRSRNEHARIDGIYTSAVAQMATAKNEKVFLKLAQQLESIADYQDASVLAKQCLEKAEAARSEQERRAEITRQKAKRNKKIAVIILSAIVACAALVVLWMNVLSPMVQYYKARSLLNRGNYDEAITIFTELEQYKDSPDKVLETKYAKADSLCANKDFDASIAIFTELEQYKDSPEKILEVTYAKAGTLAESGDYVQALELYKELAKYKDSADRMKEVNYARAGALAKDGDYESALELYKILGDYKDSATLYPTTVLDYATVLFEKNDLINSKKQLDILANFDKTNTYVELIDALYIRLMDAFYAEGQYQMALATYEKTKGYNEDSEKYKDMVYKSAKVLLELKEFMEARSNFQKVSGYLDADQMVIECNYQWGLHEFSSKNYDQAQRLFVQIKEYKDSADMDQVAKYRYVTSHKDSKDWTTYIYLKDLKAIEYKDSAEIFKELYAWKAEIIAINSDPEDEKTNKTSISVYDPVYFHIKVTGGEPGAEVTMTRKAIYPDGNTYKTKWDWAAHNGTITWVGWDTGIYQNPAYGTRGTLKLEIYDENGNMIGEGSVRMTS